MLEILVLLVLHCQNTIASIQRYFTNVMSPSLQGIVLISTWACKLIANTLMGCSVNFDHIFDLINTFQIQLPVFQSLLGSLRGIQCKIIYIYSGISFSHLGYSLSPGQVGGSSIGFDNEFWKYFPIRQVVLVGIRNSESTDVGDGFHKRKKLYVTGYRTCIYNSEIGRAHV